MAAVTVYGIKNCDTVKKTLRWLQAEKIDHHFHDYKTDGVDADVLDHALAQHGWENVINRNGTTWRKLPEDMRENMNTARARKAALDNPSLIKRPLLVKSKTITLGFDEKTYAALFRRT